MKITEWHPRTSLGNQLKLSSFPYPLLIMQMKPLKQTRSKLPHVLQAEKAHVVHADAATVPQALLQNNWFPWLSAGRTHQTAWVLKNGQAELERYGPRANHLDK